MFSHLATFVKHGHGRKAEASLSLPLRKHICNDERSERATEREENDEKDTIGQVIWRSKSLTAALYPQYLTVDQFKNPEEKSNVNRFCAIVPSHGDFRDKYVSCSLLFK